ncbi:MAG: chromosome partitioning protein [Oscillochloris sp.]|nr:chromosome partitioning protein [Oscillochloris sp.]
MDTLIFTGAAGTSARAAAATAATAAARGVRTLLASFGPEHAIGVLAGAAPTGEPGQLTPNLTLWSLDPLRDLTALYEPLRNLANLNATLAGITGEELPLIPGADLFLGVAGLRRHAADHQLICIDAGSAAGLIRAMAVPDTFRWSLRLLVGLDRDPGRSPSSLQRALIPTSLIPFPMEWLGQIQQARVELDRLRHEAVDPQQTRVRYVLPADRAGLADTRIGLPALQLYGLAVDSLIAGPVLPPGAARLALEALAAEQDAVTAEAATLWAPRPLMRLPAGATPGDITALAELGHELYAGASPLDLPEPEPPLRIGAPRRLVCRLPCRDYSAKILD